MLLDHVILVIPEIYAKVFSSQIIFSFIMSFEIKYPLKLRLAYMVISDNNKIKLCWEMFHKSYLYKFPQNLVI